MKAIDETIFQIWVLVNHPILLSEFYFESKEEKKSIALFFIEHTQISKRQYDQAFTLFYIQHTNEHKL